MSRRTLFPVNSIRTGLGILFLSLLAALTIIFTTVQGGKLASVSREDLASTLQRLEKHLEREAVLLAGQLAAQAVQPISSYNFTGLCTNLAATVEARDELLIARAILGDGRIFASSDMTELGSSPDLPIPDWKEQAEFRLRRTRFLGEDVLEVAVPVWVGNGPWGTLLLCSSLTSLSEAIATETKRTGERIDQFWISSLLLGLVILLVGSIGAFRLGRRVAEPVIRLSRSSRLISEGNLDRPVPLVGHNELASLSESMEEMRLSIRTRVADLQTILETGRSMASRLEKNELYRETGEAIRKRLEGKSVTMFTPTGGQWAEEARFGEQPEEELLQKTLSILSESRSARDSLVDPGGGAFLQIVALGDRTLAAILVHAGGPGETERDREARLFLETVANFLAVSLMNVELFAETRRRERIAHEMNTARAVQAALFPREDPAVDWLDVSGAFLPATETGGDWFGYIHRPGSDHFLVLIGDVTGHGVPPALVTAAVRGSCATLAEGERVEPHSPARVLEELNRIVFRTGRRELVMTLFAASIDRGKGTITFANAGHPLPIVTAASGGHSVLAARGPRLGDLEEPHFEEVTRSLDRGDTILFYTDGLADNRNSEGKAMGRRGIRSILRTIRDDPARHIRDRLLEKVEPPSGEDDRRDDVAMVILKCKEEAGVVAEGRK